MDHVDRHPDDQPPVPEAEPVPSSSAPLDSIALPTPFEPPAPPAEPMAAVAVPLSGFDETLPGSAAATSPFAAAPAKPTAAERLAAWHDEFFAWVKTLASAAVYATLIVTFGFQVARVEGQSMAPTLADQDRLIVNKLALPPRRRRSAATS